MQCTFGMRRNQLRCCAFTLTIMLVFGLLVRLVMCHGTGLGSNLHIENKYHFTACLFERVSLLRGHDCEDCTKHRLLLKLS